MTSIFNTTLICGWCRKEFKTRIIKNENEERNLLICPSCNHLLPSSRKKQTGEFVGTKHIHREWKNGDIVI